MSEQRILRFDRSYFGAGRDADREFRFADMPPGAADAWATIVNAIFEANVRGWMVSCLTSDQLSNHVQHEDVLIVEGRVSGLQQRSMSERYLGSIHAPVWWNNWYVFTITKS